MTIVQNIMEFKKDALMKGLRVKRIYLCEDMYDKFINDENIKALIYILRTVTLQKIKRRIIFDGIEIINKDYLAC